MSWTGVITDAGQDVFNRWMSGSGSLYITAAQVGSGYVPAENMRSATGLNHFEEPATIVSAKTENGKTKFKLRIDPAPNASFVAREIGIFGHIGLEESCLLALHQDTASDGGINIPARTTMPDFAASVYMVHEIDNSNPLAIAVDMSAHVTQSDLDDLYKTGSIDASTNISLTAKYAKQYGKVCMVRGHASISAAAGVYISTTSGTDIGTVSGISLPPATVYGVCQTGSSGSGKKIGLVSLGTNGLIKITALESNQTNADFCFTYIV